MIKNLYYINLVLLDFTDYNKKEIFDIINNGNMKKFYTKRE